MLTGMLILLSCPECWSPFKGKAEIAAHFQEVESGGTDTVSVWRRDGVNVCRMPSQLVIKPFTDFTVMWCLILGSWISYISLI